MIAEVHEKIAASLHANGWDGLLLAGPDNIAYAGGAVLPFAHQYPDRPALLVLKRDGAAAMVCPPDWADAVRDQGFPGAVSAYSEHEGRAPLPAVLAMGRLLPGLGLESATLGLDLDHASAALVDNLRARLPAVTWQPADALLRDLRLVKTPDEIELLERAAIQSDQGIVGALHHLEGTVGGPEYTVAEFAERLRVHVIEWGGSGVGHVGSVQGAQGAAYHVPPHGLIGLSGLLRMDMSNHHLGYWCQGGRMAVLGEPTVEQVAAYAGNMALKRAAVGELRPGVRCCDVFAAVERAAMAAEIPFVAEYGAGHGVGCSEAEGPYLAPDDLTPLVPGMALALDIYTTGPAGELIHSIDTYAITGDGPRLLSWYRRWDRLYGVYGIKSTH